MGCMGLREEIWIWGGISGADSIGHREHLPPHFYKWLGTGGGTVISRTANKKLTKLH